MNDNKVFKACTSVQMACVRTYGRTDSPVTAKHFELNGLPNLLAMGLRSRAGVQELRHNGHLKSRKSARGRTSGTRVHSAAFLDLKCALYF